MLGPNPHPFQDEPGCEACRTVDVELGLKFFRADPAPSDDLLGIDPDGIVAAPDEYRTQLVLGSGGVELRMIFELEQKPERATQPEFLVKTALRGDFHALPAARVAATAIGPIERPQSLGARTLLDQQLTGRIENQQRERPV
jgi:hypothetical protein